MKRNAEGETQSKRDGGLTAYSRQIDTLEILQLIESGRCVFLVASLCGSKAALKEGAAGRGWETGTVSAEARK